VSGVAAEPGVLIDGVWRQETSGGCMAVLDPSTGAAGAAVRAAGGREVAEAAAVAVAAHRDGRWRAMPPVERGRLLSLAAADLRSRAAELAGVIAGESGMPEAFARFVEVPLAAEALEFFAGLCAREAGAVLPFNPGVAPGEYLAFTLQEPAGPAALITPWNFPLLIPAWKLAAALAAGCPAILKPAPQAPRSGAALAAALERAGLPPGVVQVLCGGDDVGRALVEHPDVPVISFTGSTPAGRQVAAAAGARLKRVALELGGKSPQIVFADADLDQAAAACLFGAFWHAGQVCQASSRILVARPVYAAFAERLAAAAARLRVGSAHDPATDVGPLREPERLAEVLAVVGRAQAEGARLLAGGHGWSEGGAFMQPTVLADVSGSMEVAQRELFAPVCALMPFDSEEEAVGLANGTDFGLAAGLWTADLKRGLRLLRRIEAGIVWLNGYLLLSAVAPVSPQRGSGLAAELGAEALRPYQVSKTVVVDLNAETARFF
jgi:acyl-CoA reductase-like NAD-dependent aldehyde dehydrogenase